VQLKAKRWFTLPAAARESLAQLGIGAAAAASFSAASLTGIYLWGARSCHEIFETWTPMRSGRRGLGAPDAAIERCAIHRGMNHR
jgi:hypothetical protein